MDKCLQETYAPHSQCFGCGPANESGLKIQSFPENHGAIATWRPQSQHQAFPGMLCGGIIGTLLDCHSNWTAAWTLMNEQNAATPPCTVTADYAIKLLRPTPLDTDLVLQSQVTEIQGDRATIEAKLIANEKVCATCTGLFVAVKEGHPAYHQW